MCDRGTRLEPRPGQGVARKIFTGWVSRSDFFAHELFGFSIERFVIDLNVGRDDGATFFGKGSSGVHVHFGECIGAALGGCAGHVERVGFVAVVVEGVLPVDVELDLFERIKDVFRNSAVVGSG